MNIIFFGEDAFSAIVLDSLIKAGHSIIGTYCPIYDNNIYSRLAMITNNNGIPFNRIKDFSSDVFINELISKKPDLIVVCHFQKLIKHNVITIPKFGCINLHPSLLPKYRGMSPQHWPIINGDKKTGITVHFIDDGVDTGDIIIQQEMEIKSDETVFQLQNRFKIVYGSIVRTAIEKIELGTNSFIKQSHLPGSYYGKLKLVHCKIDLNGSYLDAFNLIRGVTFPYFGARLGDYIIWKAIKIKKKSGWMNELELGIFISENNEGYIKFNDGILKLDKFAKYERKNS